MGNIFLSDRAAITMKILSFIFLSIISCLVGQEQSNIDDHSRGIELGYLPPAQRKRQHTVTSDDIVKETFLRSATVTYAHDLLSQDFQNNLEAVLWRRELFRKGANLTEGVGNIFSSLGIGITSISAATNLLEMPNLSTILLFTGSTCFGIHLTFMGIAKYCAREERECEKHLNELGSVIRFNVIPITPIVTDSSEN